MSADVIVYQSRDGQPALLLRESHPDEYQLLKPLADVLREVADVLEAPNPPALRGLRRRLVNAAAVVIGDDERRELWQTTSRAGWRLQALAPSVNAKPGPRFARRGTFGALEPIAETLRAVADELLEGIEPT
jgi:hypothetical protein